MAWRISSSVGVGFSFKSATVAGRAEAALNGAIFDERFLDRMQRSRGQAQTLDGQHLFPLGLDCKIQAGVDRFPIQQNGTSAALPFLAGAFGPRQAEILAQHFQQRSPRRNQNVVTFTVHA